MDQNDDYAQLEVGESSLQETLCSREGSFISDLDADIAICAGRGLKYFISLPIDILGIPANLVIMWVWSSELGYHPTTYLFRAQALADTLALVSAIVFLLVEGTFIRDIVVYTVSKITVQVGVQITMLLAIVRLIKVFFPLYSEQLLTSFRVKFVLAGFIVWSLSAMHFVNYLRVRESKHYVTASFIFDVTLSSIVPAGLQLILMIMVTWRARSVFGRIEPATDHGRAVSFQQDNQKARRLVYTVSAMCVFTFIPYFVGAYFFIFIRRSSVGQKLLPYRHLIHAIFGVFRHINSSINIVLYFFFIIKFKALLYKKLRKIRQNCKSRKFFFSFSGSTLPEGQTMTTSPDGDKIIIDKELPEDATGRKLPACSFKNTADEKVTESSTARAPLTEIPSAFDTYIT